VSRRFVYSVHSKIFKQTFTNELSDYSVFVFKQFSGANNGDISIHNQNTNNEFKFMTI